MASFKVEHLGADLREKLHAASAPTTVLPIYTDAEPKHGVFVSIDREGPESAHDVSTLTNTRVAFSADTFEGLGSLVGCAEEVVRVFPQGAVVEIRAVGPSELCPTSDLIVHIDAPDAEYGIASYGIATHALVDLVDDQAGLLHIVRLRPGEAPNITPDSPLLDPIFIQSAAENAVLIAQRRINGLDHLI